MSLENDGANQTSSAGRRQADVRRLRTLWIGLALYFLISLNGLRYVSRVPYPAAIAGELVNAAIIVTIFVAIRRVTKRLRN
jgi:hypothetical protein